MHHRRGELRLAYCEGCGLITNVAYNPADHQYSGRYEETQGYSPTFNAFAKILVDRLIEQYDLHGKTVLEIGCGKGEFLARLCREGENRGIGVDPSFVPGRLAPEDEARLVVHREFYGAQHFQQTPDFVCCRHTLEHIPNVREFLSLVREGIGSRRQVGVFFDLPDVLRVLREGAFWDLYYEHCSYFTLGSLARLFRAARFDVQDLSLDYDDQWLMLHALPADHPTAASMRQKDERQDLEQAVNEFAARCAAGMDLWRERIQRVVDDGGRVVVWGSGSKGVAFLVTLGITDQIEFVVDINPRKHGKYMPGSGQEIVGPEFLREYRPSHVIVMNPIYCDEIGQELKHLSLDAQLLPV